MAMGSIVIGKKNRRGVYPTAEDYMWCGACVKNIGYVEAKTSGVGVLFDPRDEQTKVEIFAWAEKKSSVCEKLPTIVREDIKGSGVGGNTLMMFMTVVVQGCPCVEEELYKQFAGADGNLSLDILEKLSPAFAA